jgi:hypothetical protein
MAEEQGNKLYSPAYLEWFDRNNVARPHHQDHMNVEDISKHLKKLKTHSWKLEGNLLTAQTDMGKLSQTIPPNYILTGEDSDGMPILKRIDL